MRYILRIISICFCFTFTEAISQETLNDPTSIFMAPLTYTEGVENDWLIKSPIEKSQFEIANGDHKLIFDYQFKNKSGSIVKLEMKTTNDGDKKSYRIRYIALGLKLN